MDTLAAISNMAVILASLTAIYGIVAWKYEHIGKRRLEIAEDVLAMFYEACDAIKAIRSPFGFEGEGGTRKAKGNETSEQKRIRDLAFSVYERYYSNKEIFNRLHSMRYRFMAIYGADKSKPFMELYRIRNMIFRAAGMLAVEWERDLGIAKMPDQEKKHREAINKYESIIWEDNANPDPITPLMDNIISDIETTCRDIISGRNMTPAKYIKQYMHIFYDIDKRITGIVIKKP